MKKEELPPTDNSRVNKFFFLTFLFIILTGCASTTNYQWKINGNIEKFYRDNAQCKLMARNAANNVPGYNNQTYHVTSYDYVGGSSESVIEPDYIQEVIGNVIQGFQADAEERETYKLCMQSKGYYLKNTSAPSRTSVNRTRSSSQKSVRNKRSDSRVRPLPGPSNPLEQWLPESMSNRNVTRDNERRLGESVREASNLPTGLHCTDSIQCPDKMLCDETEGVCISSIDWVKKYEEKERRRKHKNPCEKAKPCPKKMMHDGPDCKCITFYDWAKKYAE